MMADRALKKADMVCQMCMNKIWGELLYRWRETLNAAMPDSVKKRPNCWFGRECKTQSHNQQHAAKYNHICENMKKP